MFFLFSLFFVLPLPSSHFPLGLHVFPIFLFSPCLSFQVFPRLSLQFPVFHLHLSFSLFLVNISNFLFSPPGNLPPCFSLVSPSNLSAHLLGLKDPLSVFSPCPSTHFYFPSPVSPFLFLFSPVPPFSFPPCLFSHFTSSSLLPTCPFISPSFPPYLIICPTVSSPQFLRPVFAHL